MKILCDALLWAIAIFLLLPVAVLFFNSSDFWFLLLIAVVLWVADRVYPMIDRSQNK